MSDALPATPFSYDSPEVKPIAAKLYAQAVAIKTSMGQGVSAMIDAGEKLAAVRDMLPHGAWGPWLAAEFGWSESTARRYIAVFERFGANRSRVTGFSAQALYLLASPATPDAAVEEIAERQAAGEALSTATVKEVVQRARKPKPTIAEAGEGAPAKNIPGESGAPSTAIDLPMLHAKLAGIAEAAETIDKLRKGLKSLLRVYARDPDLHLAAAGMVGLLEQLDDLAMYVARQLWPEGQCPACKGMRATVDGECVACRGGGWTTKQGLHGNGRK